MKSITIISTQMQLLNAIEAINKFNCKVNYLIVFAASNKRLRQIEYILENKNYSNSFKLIYYFSSEVSRFRLLFKLFSFIFFVAYIFKNNKFDYSIIGNYNFIIHRYIQYIAKKQNKNIREILVDDGLSIIDYINSRRNELCNNIPILSGSKIFKFVFKIINFKSYISPCIIYFSVYTDLKISNVDSFIINEYVYLKSKLNVFSIPYQLKKRIYILGQPLVENNLFDRKTYNFYLKYIYERFSTFSNERLIYIPHPSENIDQNIDNENVNYFDIISLQLPFEIFAFNIDPKSIIISFYTSTLINLKKMNFDFKLYSLYIVPKDIESIYYAKIKLAYNEIKKNDINLIYK